MALSVFTGIRNAFAYAFGVNSQVPALKIFSGGSTTSGTYSITLDYGFITAQDGTRVALTARMPINLGTSTSNETITPTTVSNPTPDILGTCVITGTFSHAHGVGELVSSGDGGLSVAQIAASLTNSGGGGLVAVDAVWGNAVGSNADPCRLQYRDYQLYFGGYASSQFWTGRAIPALSATVRPLALLSHLWLWLSTNMAINLRSVLLGSCSSC